MQGAFSADRNSLAHVSLGSEPPLCVDLDGTLIYSDLLFESLLSLLRSQPLMLARVPFWAMRGRSHLKHQLALRADIDVSILPYNREVLDWLRNEQVRNRKLILATAASHLLAQRVNEFLGLFDVVIGSAPSQNGKGHAKLSAIQAAIGPDFDYVGDSRADAPLFTASRKAFQVQAKNTPSLSALDDKQFRRSFQAWKFVPVLLVQLRVHQWAKNGLIFLPLISAHELNRPDLWWRALWCFVCFSITASSVYVLNDLIDLEADRHHPRKRNRPLASGALPITLGLMLVPVLLLLGLGGAFLLNWQSGAVSISYFLLTILYTFRVKRLVLYDVFTLAFLYSIRLFAGQAAYGVSLSTWLVSCCFFLFLSLAFCKRTSELVNHQSASSAAGVLEDVQLLRRDYRFADLPIISCFGVVSGMLAGLITVLYVESENVRKLYHHPQVLWFLCPLLLQWVARNWILASRGQITEDPVLFVLKERATWITTAVGAALMLAASI